MLSNSAYSLSIKVILTLSLIIALTALSTVQAAPWSSPLNLTNSQQPEADAYISGNGEKVAFARNDGEDWEIFVINSDGTGLKQLTDNSVDDRDPVISADGSKVAFRHGVFGQRQICIINSDGSGFKELTDGTHDDVEVCISGDGNKIAFTRMTEKNIHLCVIDSNGAGFKQLTDRQEDYIPFVRHPSISFDGSKIAFGDSTASALAEVFVINSDGTGLIQLTTDGTSFITSNSPSISGDGSKIGFQHSSSMLNENNTEIFIIRSDGTGLKQLTHNDIGDGYLSISGDGTKIAFQQGFDNYTEIFIISSDGSGLMQLTNNNANDRYPSISDRGDKVVFESDGDIFIVVNTASQDNEMQPTENSGQMDNANGESAFPTEILVGGIVALIITAAVLGAVYLKRK